MKQRKWLIFLTGIILTISLAGSILVFKRPNTDIVEILQDNEVLYRLDLSEPEDQVLVIEYEGRSNTIEVKDHQIHILDADCPDHTCMSMGWLDSAAPIICLPNHLVIRFTNNDMATDAIVQ